MNQNHLNINKMESVKVEVEMDFKDGKRTIEMELKRRSDIEECDEGKVVVLNLINGQTFTGVFKGMDGDEDIMLQSLNEKSTMGLKAFWVRDYLEETR